ncbi:MAG: carbon-nitrogen hydrolase family protein [bacterium]|nr:carbon-nitrogen hydrolase family protein [bacterium]
MPQSIAMAQVCATHDLAANLAKALDLINQAAAQGAKMILFPESFLFLGRKESEYLSIAEPIPGPIVNQFCEAAKAQGIWILMGGFCEKNPENPAKTYNTSVLIDDRGTVQSRYRKIHLFDTKVQEVNLQESKTVAPGQEIITAESPIGLLGMTICYDLRFPCLFQALRRTGAQVMLVPAAFTIQTGRFHWKPLLQARAIETQSYVIAPGQVGRHNEKRQSYGHSLLIDPWGQVLAEGDGEQEELVFGEVDLEHLAQVREQMPVFEHRVAGVDWSP